MELTPEWFKQATSKQRYERLVGHISGLQMQLDVAERLVGRYEPPERHSWQVPSVEELKKDVKAARESVASFRRKLRKYEADLLAKPWKV